MNHIRFQHILPRVFDTMSDNHSDVWLKDIRFEKGKHYLLQADSGKGKSTLCSYLLGYRNDYSGQLLFDDKDTAFFSIAQWTEVRQQQVSLMFQELRLFPELTAYENVEIKNALTQHLSEDTIREWFSVLDIADKWSTKVAHMSFGQQQRVALIRAMAQPFDFLVVDEPVSHLDDTNAARMAQLIEEEVKKQQAGLIVTSIGKHFQINYDQTLRL